MSEIPLYRQVLHRLVVFITLFALIFSSGAAGLVEARSGAGVPSAKPAAASGFLLGDKKDEQKANGDKGSKNEQAKDKPQTDDKGGNSGNNGNSGGAKDKPAQPPPGDKPVPSEQQGGASAPSRVIHARIGDYDCEDGEWHFVITQVRDEESAPDSITVTWSNGDSEDIELSAFTGQVAHYTSNSNLDSRVTSATAEIYDEWRGEFNLSHGPCGQQTSTPSRPTRTAVAATHTRSAATNTRVRPSETRVPTHTRHATNTRVRPTGTHVMSTRTAVPTRTHAPSTRTRVPATSTATRVRATGTRTAVHMTRTPRATGTPHGGGCQFAILSFHACIDENLCATYSIPPKNEGETPITLRGSVTLEGRSNREIGYAVIPETVVPPNSTVYVNGTVCSNDPNAQGPYKLHVRVWDIGRVCDEKHKQQPLWTCDIRTRTPRATRTADTTRTPEMRTRTAVPSTRTPHATRTAAATNTAVLATRTIGLPTGTAVLVTNTPAVP